jgi:CP family cyanate transporter-like MFS transporter
MSDRDGTTSTRRQASAPTTVLLVVTVLVTALNLRPAVVAVAPLIDQIRSDLAISSTAASLLTTLPLLCFGIGSLPAAGLTRRRGMTTVLLGAMIVLLVGIVVRLVPSAWFLFAGTIVAGLAIALGNVLVPALIKRDFTGNAVGRLLGAETMMISAGGAISAALMVPAQRALGWSWRPTLALWAIVAAAAVALWLVLRARRTPQTPPMIPVLSTAVVPGMWRSAMAWQVTLFMGLQSLHFYAVTTWAPTLFVEHSYSSAQGGLLLAVAGFISLPANYVTPVLAGRRSTQHHLVGALIVLLGAGYVGILAAPGLAVVWMVVIGLGQGVGLSLGHSFFALRTRDAEATSQLSSMAQGAGYCVAALGPLGVGVLRDLSGGWDVPLVALMIMLIPMAVAGFAAARDRSVTPEGARP